MEVLLQVGCGEEPLVSPPSSTTAYSSYSRLRLLRGRPQSQSRLHWCLLVCAIILCAGGLTSTGIYFGYSHLVSLLPVHDRVYRGLVRGRPLPEANTELQPEEVRRLLHHRMEGSNMTAEYRFTEVFLVDRQPGGPVFHFSLHFRGQGQGWARGMANRVQGSLRAGLEEGALLPSSLQVGEWGGPSRARWRGSRGARVERG